MRYSVISKGLTITELQLEVNRCGGKNLRVAVASKQVFCDLDDVGLVRLRTVPGLTVKKIGKISTDISAPSITPIPPPTLAGMPVYGASQASLSSGFYDLRNAFDPPLVGARSTLAILDSGVRKTHEGLLNKFVYEANFSDSPTCEDIFDHGTGVAYLACGGTNGPGEESGITPGAYFMNIKVLNDIGVGTEEAAVLGIECVIELKEQAVQQGLSPSDPFYPSGLNMSWGAPDDGDPDNPIRVACRALPEHGLLAFASAGNGGPNPGTVTMPACEPLPAVVAVGVVTISPFQIAEYSSRGPTKEGFIKPDGVFFGHRMLTASSKSDTAYTIKSGTSFAAPGIAGAANLGAELLMRLLGQEIVDIPEGVELVKENLMKYAVKPAGIPAGQDNNYGYGLPAGDLILGAVRPALMDLSMITPILGLAMVGMMVPSLIKGMK